MSDIFEPSTNTDNTKNEYKNVTKQETNTPSSYMESNEKDYYISRIIRHKTKLIKHLIFLLLTLLLDIFCTYAYYFIFYNLINLCIIYSFLLWTIILLCIYKNAYSNIEKITIASYIAIKRNIVITKIFYFLIISDIIYIIAKKMFIDNKRWTYYYYHSASLNEIFLSIVGVIVYIILNLVFPYYIIKKLNRIKRLLNAVGMLKGQEYSVTYIVDAPKLGLNGTERKVEIN